MFLMRRFSLFLLLVALVATRCYAEGDCNEGDGVCANPEAAEVAETPSEDPNCPSRALVIKCAAIHLDKNGNNKLDRDELDAAIDSLPWYSRGLFSVYYVATHTCYLGRCYLTLSISCPPHPSLPGILNILGSVDKMMKK